MSKDPSVLIVDDDEGLANILAVTLSQQGFEVRTANNGSVGCSAYFEEPTDWVVTDIQMPELDGIKMMQCIRLFNPSVKVVYMSGEVEKYHKLLDQEVSAFGAGVLHKPFTRGDLIDEIAGVHKTTEPKHP